MAYDFNVGLEMIPDGPDRSYRIGMIERLEALVEQVERLADAATRLNETLCRVENGRRGGGR